VRSGSFHPRSCQARRLVLCPGPLVEPRWHKITTTNLRRSSVASALEWRDDTERARDDTNARKVTEEMRGEVLRRTFERGPSPREVCSTSVTTNRTFRDILVFAGRAAETMASGKILLGCFLRVRFPRASGARRLPAFGECVNRLGLINSLRCYVKRTYTYSLTCISRRI
jgi:hypothetical protein